MRHSLFFKIYLTLLVSVLAVALVGAGLIFFGQSQTSGDGQGPVEALLAAALPPPQDLAGTQATLARIAQAFDADASLFTAQGRLIVAVGAPLEFIDPAHSGLQAPGSGHGRFVSRLPDGRVLIARLDTGFGPGPGGPLGLLAAIAVLSAVLAWLVVRQVTRQLGLLRDGVQAWGAGDLARRVPVIGQDELAAVAVSFNQAAQRLEHLVTAHKNLLANASHELRSPLARLGLAVQLFQDHPRDDTRCEIERNLVELDSLVDEILLASRLDQLLDTKHHRPVQLLAILAEEAARQDVAVSGEPALVQGDARLLARLVRNLLQNAVLHGGPPVLASLRHTPDAMELRVRDHGAGIGDSGARIFEPFYRPPERAETAGGWGLGLALVRQIAERHGASVRYESPADGGACFIVTFPLRNGAA